MGVNLKYELFKYLFAKQNTGNDHIGVTKFTWNSLRMQTNAYGVQQKLNEKIIKMTIPVIFLCLLATISAILPEALIEFYK